MELLYPRIGPFDQRMLPTGDGHTIYVEQCGSPGGIPVVYLHGGPGGGCSPLMRRYFDPEAYRIVLFDQRGCGRSMPTASVANNTTQHLIGDIELIRSVLEIDRFILFGGSWGATLALLYAQSHPDRVAYLVLRGIFLMMQRELEWFYGGAAGNFWPERWQDFVEPIPEDERGDLIGAYHRRLFSGDREEERRSGRRWLAWENAMTTMEGQRLVGGGAGEYARTFARIESHFFVNRGFLSDDRQILSGMTGIARIPGKIVHGRFDLVCQPRAAWELASAWPRSDLRFVMAGHALSEQGITKELLRTMNDLRSSFSSLGF